MFNYNSFIRIISESPTLILNYDLNPNSLYILVFYIIENLSLLVALFILSNHKYTVRKYKRLNLIIRILCVFLVWVPLLLYVLTVLPTDLIFEFLQLKDFKISNYET